LAFRTPILAMDHIVMFSDAFTNIASDIIVVGEAPYNIEVGLPYVNSFDKT
jgi:hypothetical protein